MTYQDNTPSLAVRRFEPALRRAFFELHHPANGEGHCNCVAWWVPTWDGWDERTTQENRALREQLLAAGQYDGYLAFDGERPIGWMQVGPRDRLEKLRTQLHLQPEPNTWAITCILILPAYRRQGVAHQFLAGVLEDLTARGVQRVQAYPRPGRANEDGEAWNGPEALFERAGFSLMVMGDPRHVYHKELG